MRFLSIAYGFLALFACDDGSANQACELASVQVNLARSALRAAEIRDFNAKEAAEELRVEAAQASCGDIEDGGMLF